MKIFYVSFQARGFHSPYLMDRFIVYIDYTFTVHSACIVLTNEVLCSISLSVILFFSIFSFLGTSLQLLTGSLLVGR